jgi:hypothetical protein
LEEALNLSSDRILNDDDELVRVIIDALNISEAVTVQVRTGPVRSRMLRLPCFKTIGTWMW